MNIAHGLMTASGLYVKGGEDEGLLLIQRTHRVDGMFLLFVRRYRNLSVMDFRMKTCGKTILSLLPISPFQ
uniref:SH2 domain-containing protein n=1 Tax=Steinernema glaseri TaxID=37863 RepID=A0A1I7YWC8_9BILA